MGDNSPKNKQKKQKQHDDHGKKPHQNQSQPANQTTPKEAPAPSKDQRKAS